MWRSEAKTTSLTATSRLTSRGERRGDSILETHDVHRTTRLVERHDRPAQIIEAVEHGARPYDVHDLEEVALVVLLGLFMVVVAGWWWAESSIAFKIRSVSKL